MYIALLFHIFGKRTKNLSISISVSFLSFINNSFFVSQEKSYEKSNVILYYNYSIIASLFDQFKLMIEHNKLEVFHFLRSTRKTEPSPLDLRPPDSVILKPKDTQCYLGFFFNKKLSFQHYTYYYTNKALSTVKDIKILGNSIRELSLVHKCLLYRTCILSIILYGFQL